MTKRKPRPQMSPELAAYWAGSISASVDACYATGNVQVIHAGRPDLAAKAALSDSLLPDWRTL